MSFCKLSGVELCTLFGTADPLGTGPRQFVCATVAGIQHFKFRDRHSQRRMARAYGLRRTRQNIPFVEHDKVSDWRVCASGVDAFEPSSFFGVCREGFVRLEPQVAFGGKAQLATHGGDFREPTLKSRIVK
jgi:hypothetical protein